MGEFERLSRNWWVHFIFYMGDRLDNFGLVLDLISREGLESLAFVLLYLLRGPDIVQHLECLHSSDSRPSN